MTLRGPSGLARGFALPTPLHPGFRVRRFSFLRRRETAAERSAVMRKECLCRSLWFTAAGLWMMWLPQMVHAGDGVTTWVEDFADDPIAAGRFEIPHHHDDSRFSYDATEQRLVVHYDTFEPTAWYVRPLDEAGELTLGLCDAYEFSVTFRIRSDGFFADPHQFAQIGWGLINTETTGDDRAGGEGPAFAFDVVGFDYYPNVSPFFGGPTLGSTLIHSDSGAGFFSAIEFAFGAESQIDSHLGDSMIALDTQYTANVQYDPAGRVLTLRILQGNTPLAINADGGGGPGGPDGDPTTIQTYLFQDAPIEVNAFSLMAWQDTFNPFDSSVIADVEILQIAFTAMPALRADLNFDGVVNGLDVAPFVVALLGGPADACVADRADLDNDGEVTLEDVTGFAAALLSE